MGHLKSGQILSYDLITLSSYCELAPMSPLELQARCLLRSVCSGVLGDTKAREETRIIGANVTDPTGFSLFIYAA